MTRTKKDAARTPNGRKWLWHDKRFRIAIWAALVTAVCGLAAYCCEHFLFGENGDITEVNSSTNVDNSRYSLFYNENGNGSMNVDGPVNFMVQRGEDGHTKMIMSSTNTSIRIRSQKAVP